MLFLPGRAQTCKLELTDDSNLDIDLLLQVQTRAIQRGAPAGEHWGKEFLVRRMRLMLFGEAGADLPLTAAPR